MRITAAMIAFAASVGVASAAALDIGGSYGNAAGCDYVKTLETAGAAYEVLTPDGFSKFGMACRFVETGVNEDGLSATASCTNTEDESVSEVRLRIERTKGGFAVFGPEGQLAEVKRCQ